MTTVVTTASSGPYTAAAQTTFDVEFQSLSETEIDVRLDGVGVGGWTFVREEDGTGQVVFATPVTGTVVIYSAPDWTQRIEFQRFGAFYPDRINPGFDRLARMILALRDVMQIVDDGGADSLLRSELLATTGGDLINFLAGSGVSRTVRSKLRDTVSVKDFGAVGNGIAVDTTAIQAAIAYVSGLGGGVVELPAGVYLTGTLNLPTDVLLRGAGKYATRLVATSGLNATLINRAGTLASVINRGGVEELTVVGSGKANVNMVGIRNVYTNRASIRNVDVHGCRIGIYTENVWQDNWDNVHVHGGGTQQNYTGFYFGPRAAVVGVSNAVNAVNCVAQGVEKYGWRIENCNGSAFSNCQAMDGETGWYIGAPTTGAQNLEFALFSNCQADTNSSHNWRLEKGTAGLLTGMQFHNCWAGSSGGSNLWVSEGDQLVFSGWKCRSAVQNAIYLSACARCSINGGSLQSFNNASGAQAGIALVNSLAMAITGLQAYTATPGTGKSIVETGTSNYNCIVGNVLSTPPTIIGANTVNASNVLV